MPRGETQWWQWLLSGGEGSGPGHLTGSSSSAWRLHQAVKSTATWDQRVDSNEDKHYTQQRQHQ